MDALRGIKVLDLTRLLPGPLCSMYLADFGADIIKIEDPFTGDYARTMEPYIEGVGALYELTNRGKRNLCLNLQSAEGKEVFLRLLTGADILIEGFRPGVMKKLGLDYETVKAINPGIVYCSITGYGQTSPQAYKAGHDLNYVGYTGLLHEMIRSNDHKPVLPAMQLADIGGGTLAAVNAVLLGLLNRMATGEGQYFDVSMTDGILPFMVPILAYHLADKENGRSGYNPLTGALACYNVYETKDGRWFALGALEVKFWKRFCEIAGLMHLPVDHWHPEKQKILRETLTEYFSSVTSDELTALFEKEDVCLTPVLTVEEAIVSPHAQARRLYPPFPARPGVLTTKNPLRMDEHVAKQPAPPARGQHTEEILRSLGYTEDEISRLKENRVVQAGAFLGRRG
jgi:alpha-methylacyl-CoA racemase